MSLETQHELSQCLCGLGNYSVAEILEMQHDFPSEGQTRPIQYVDNKVKIADAGLILDALQDIAVYRGTSCASIPPEPS